MKKERRKVMRMWMTVSSVVLLAIAADAQAQVARDTTSAPTGEGAAPATPAGTVAAEPRKDYTQISLEELLNKHITVSATKTRVDVAKAPVSVSIITPEDIQRSGATRLGDVLRTVPGLDVLEPFPGHISVSARGTGEIFVNNMLVLIDGRRLEQQANGVPFFEKAPLRLEDIKRIEVIKGPAGAIYGTNALAGIISITTYSPGEVEGTLLTATAGERDTYETTVRQAGRIGATGWFYKLLGGYTYTSTWSSLAAADGAPPVALRKGDGLLALERQFSDESRLLLEGGYSQGDLASLTLVVPQTRYFKSPHFRAAYDRPEFHAQLSYSPQRIELRERQGPVQVLRDNAYAAHLSLDRTWKSRRGSTVTLGGNAREQRTTFTNLGPAHSQGVWSVFGVLDQSLVGDRMRVVGALGVGDHPEIPLQLDGNAALILTPIDDHSLRLSFGRAHRDPSFGENFFDFPRQFPGGRQGYQAGNTELAPESLVSLEAGYHGLIRAGSSTLGLFAEAFRADVKDLIAAPAVNVPAGTIAQYPTATVLQQFKNLEDRKGWGYETGFEWRRGALQLNGQYGYQRFENADTGVLIVKDVPRHKTSGGARLTKGALDLDVWAHAVSRTVEAKGYVLLNPRLALRTHGWTVSVQAFNALDDVHVETSNDRGVTGENVRRMVSFSLTRTLGALRRNGGGR
jgi:outer membrane cobalamin receptor